VGTGGTTTVLVGTGFGGSTVLVFEQDEQDTIEASRETENKTVKLLDKKLIIASNKNISGEKKKGVRYFFLLSDALLGNSLF
jgi:galactokinase